MANADKALADFELELQKQSKKGLSADIVATLGSGVGAIRNGTSPRLLAAVAEKLERVAGILRALAPTTLAALPAKLDSAIARLALGDRLGALKELRDAKALLEAERNKLTPKDEADLARDLDAAIASLAGPKR